MLNFISSRREQTVEQEPLNREDITETQNRVINGGLETGK